MMKGLQILIYLWFEKIAKFLFYALVSEINQSLFIIISLEHSEIGLIINKKYRRIRRTFFICIETKNN